MRRFFVLVALLLAAVSPALGQTAKEQLRLLQEQAMASYKAGKFDDCAKNFAAALDIRPHHPRLLYNFAACSTKAGKPNDALRALTEYADMGLIAEVEKDDDFAALKGTPAFQAVLDKMRANGRPIGESKIVVRLKESFLAEGIAWDDAGKRFFVSSVDQRKIVQIAADGTISDFIPSGRSDLLGAFGMAIDPKNNLWVATSGVAHARDLKPDQRGAATVAVYWLKDRSGFTFPLWRPEQGKEFVFGDIGIDSQGNAFVTDSLEPVIHSARLPDRWTTSPPPTIRNENFGSLQGLTFTPDEKALIVADYAAGIHFIDRTTNEVSTVRFAGGTTLLGIDGLYRAGNQLIAVQNGVAPIRILALTLDASGRNISAVRVLSANDPNIPEPSLGTIKGNDFCVIANAQWSRFDDNGVRKQELDPPHIACVKLP